MTDSLDWIYKSDHEWEQDNNRDPKPAKDPKLIVDVKKTKTSALNSKLNSLLTSKKIDLNKMGESIKKVNKTHEL